MTQLDIFEDTSSSQKEKKKKRISRYLQIEERLWSSGFKQIAGCDEVGRGPLAGPVVACACILPQSKRFKGVKDSKQLTEEERLEVYQELISNPDVFWATSTCDHLIIDSINILRASLLAMKQALDALSLKLQPDFVLIDGRDTFPLHLPHQAIIKGDSLSQSIAAASIIAKVQRDNMMQEFHKKWPEYGFHEHKGYGTKSHLEAIEKYGLSPIHRKSFSPVQRVVALNEPELYTS